VSPSSGPPSPPHASPLVVDVEPVETCQVEHVVLVPHHATNRGPGSLLLVDLMMSLCNHHSHPPATPSDWDPMLCEELVGPVAMQGPPTSRFQISADVNLDSTIPVLEAVTFSFSGSRPARQPLPSSSPARRSCSPEGGVGLSSCGHDHLGGTRLRRVQDSKATKPRRVCYDVERIVHLRDVHRGNSFEP
jgi:hypothetical protein